MKKIISTSVVLTLAFAGPAWAEAIEGVWKRPNGILVKIAPCGDTYCATAASGPHKGGHADKLDSAVGGTYTATLTDLVTDKNYSGKGSVNGNRLSNSGCILGGLICKSEAWTRQ